MYELSDPEAQKRCSDVVDNLCRMRHDEDETGQTNQVKFLVPLMKRNSETGILRVIFNQVSFKLGFCANTFVQYYFLMSNRLYKYITSVPAVNLKKYRNETILYNTIFDIKHLETFGLREDFGLNLNILQGSTSAEANIHLVHLRPREDIFKRYDPSFMAEFRFFVVQAMFRPSRRVKIFLKSWFDISVDECAHIGIDKSTRIGDMTREQFLQLFCCIRSSHNYKDSTFLSAARQNDENFAYIAH